jgi:hypothetical protein
MRVFKGLKKPTVNEGLGPFLFAVAASSVVILFDQAYSLGLITIPFAFVVYMFVKAGMTWKYHKALHFLLGLLLVIWLAIYSLIRLWVLS